ncbi:MAG: DUF1080 domain-containing protein, partial [Prosthecobacter sp.]|nr:DUF1080 domain-containing protein [Prosthecobacter sp.]
GTGGVVFPKLQDSDGDNSAPPVGQEPAKGVAAPPKHAALGPMKAPTPAASTTPVAIDLLARVDVMRDAIEGDWKLVNGELTGSGRTARLAFDFQAPEEYDFRIRFTRMSGVNAVAQHLARGDRDVFWLMGGFNNSAWGFEQVGGARGNANATTVKSGLDNGRRYESVVKVRRDHVQVEVDGIQVADYKTDGSDWSTDPRWTFPDPKKLGVGCQEDTVFHSVEVISMPSATASPTALRAIDLLALVEVKRDALVGEWTRTASTVSVARPTGASVLQLPYQVPEEYDFEMEFTPDDAGANVNQYLSAAGHSFAWKLNAHSRTPPLYGLDLLDGKFCSQFDEAAVRTSTAIEPGRRYRSTVEVRRDGLRALLDGKELLKWSGDFKRLSMEAIMRLRDDQHLGIGSWNRAVTFHKIEVREVTGTGKIEGSATVAVAEALFDGRTFAGWKTTNDTAPEVSWRVEAGALLSSTKSVLRTIEEFGDCELDFEWRVGPGGNGGVFYHMVGDPLAAPEMQLCDPAFSGNTPSGGLFAVVQPQSDASKPLGEWNTARLVISGSRREHWINGQKVCAYDVADAGFLATLGASKFAGKPQFGAGSRGALALQNNGGEVAYRNLRIRRR